jgi:lipopolysaccharide transport system ATP-binding protein
MGDLAIRVENLSKLYRIGPRLRYRTLRDSLTDAMYAPFRRLPSLFGNSQFAIRNSQSNNTIWAIKDVSFEVKRGDVIGIIGRNGSGKSTLLKILSRITEPTEGHAEIHGRVGSLLEVGTGFHSELTGRENIYLNGAIIGMKKAEIDRKFDEIVAFAEVARFIDTPVKHYSSGMQVRLAFAVAAHLETEILFVDEVLAVGDAAFQKKCLGKMRNVAKEGRTVLFVSHNMGAIKALCASGMVLEAGHMALRGDIENCIKWYHEASLDSQAAASVTLLGRRRTPSSDLVQLKSLTLMDGKGLPSTVFRYNDPLALRLSFCVVQPLRVAVEVLLKGACGERIAAFASSYFHGVLFQCDPSRDTVIDLVIPRLPLACGRYILDIGLAISRAEWLDFVENACSFDVEVSDPGETGFSYEQTHGFIYIEHDWKSASPPIF